MQEKEGQNHASARKNVSLQKAAIALAILLLLLKFAAFFLTHSNAILTDALESIANVAAGIMGMYSLLLAAKPRDAMHPYGHGKIEFVSASVEGGMVLLAGLFIIGKSVYNLFYENKVEHLDPGILLIAVAGVLNFIMGRILERRGTQSSSAVLLAGGKHLQSDAWSTAALLIGLFLIRSLSYAWLDSAVAICFGLLIIYQGYRIVRRSVGGMMDEADTALLQSVIATLDAHRRENWVDIHNLRIIKYGASLHFDCHLTVPYYFTVLEGHEELDKMEALIRRKHESGTEWFVHLDACVPPKMCRICIKHDCPVRAQENTGRISWSLDNVIRNRKHGID